MELGDLFEVLVAISIVAAGLFGGGKKKKKTTSKPTLPTPQRPRAPGAPAAQHRARERAAALDDLQRQLESARRTEALQSQPEAYSLEQGIGSEVHSLETLIPAGEASHARFHHQYISPLPELRPVEQRATLPPGGVRAAVVWAEILGPPKGLQRY